jgi:hypothetical protein
MYTVTCVEYDCRNDNKTAQRYVRRSASVLPTGCVTTGACQRGCSAFGCVAYFKRCLCLLQISAFCERCVKLQVLQTVASASCTNPRTARGPWISTDMAAPCCCRHDHLHLGARAQRAPVPARRLAYDPLGMQQRRSCRVRAASADPGDASLNSCVSLLSQCVRHGYVLLS